MKIKWLQTRSAKKFFRSRLTAGALLVIGLYVAVTLAIFAGAVSLEYTKQELAAGNVPGFWSTPTREEQFSFNLVYLDRIERAFAQPDIKEAFQGISFGHLKVRDIDPAELEALTKKARAIQDSLADIEDLDTRPDTQPRIDEFETTTLSIFEELSAGQKFVRWWELSLGTDRQGRSIFLRAVYSVKVALQVGTVTAFIAVIVGSILGASAGWYGGWVDHIVIWLYTTFSSIPNIVLLILLAYMFTGSGVEQTLIPLYVSFGLTFWVGPCRVIRAETLKLKELEYVHAATAIGFNRFYILMRHILPNASHLMLINFSLLFIGAVKSEVILSYLGLGVKDGPSWGIMISQSASEVINGFFWQIGTAVVFMFGLVMAFNIVSDALQDAFDPKHAGSN
jgi:peptide/nickel transport system permease protein